MIALKPKQELLRIAITQLSILNAAWGFYILVSIRNPLPLPDTVARWVYNNPTETTVVVTMAATVVSAMTLNCFTSAAKLALRQYIDSRRSISLANLSIGVALAGASFTFKRQPRYLGPTLGTLVVAVAFGMVNSAWTTFLSPTQINVLVSMHGQELDLGHPDFDLVLGQDMNNTFVFSNGTLVTQPNSANSLTSVAFTGGLTRAAAYASGQPGILNFNDIAFNVSTGGILSAAPGYGPQDNVSIATSGTPASFGGGPIPTNVIGDYNLTGISHTFNMSQQGLTANVSCFNYTNPADWYPIEIQAISVNATFVMDGYVSGVFPVVNTTLPRMVCNPNISAQGMIATIAAVNFNNSNYLASVVCPYTWREALYADNIVVYHVGLGKYATLPPTICKIVPLLTRSSVIYADQRISATPLHVTPISYQRNINFWLALLIELEEWSFQTPRVNSLGNMLFSLLASGSASLSETPTQSYQMFLLSQQEYWKGVIEVFGTALRSGYAVYPQNVTSLQIPIHGTRTITTIGWSFGNGNNRVYTLIPITVTAFVTFSAILFTLFHIRRSQRKRGLERVEGLDVPARLGSQDRGRLGSLMVPHTAIGTFDATDPIHLLVASTTRQLAPGLRPNGYWEQYDEDLVTLQLER